MNCGAPEFSCWLLPSQNTCEVDWELQQDTLGVSCDGLYPQPSIGVYADGRVGVARVCKSTLSFILSFL